jgi:hypothetical protein
VLQVLKSTVDEIRRLMFISINQRKKKMEIQFAPIKFHHMPTTSLQNKDEMIRKTFADLFSKPPNVSGKIPENFKPTYVNSKKKK